MSRYAQLHRLLAERRGRLPYTPAPPCRYPDRACARSDRRGVCGRHRSRRCRSAVRPPRSISKMRPPSSGSSGLRQSAASNTMPSPGLSGRHAVRLGGLDHNPAVGNLQHASHQHAAMPRSTAFHHGLMIRAGEEERARARANTPAPAAVRRRGRASFRPAQASSTAWR